MYYDTQYKHCTPEELLMTTKAKVPIPFTSNKKSTRVSVDPCK